MCPSTFFNTIAIILWILPEATQYDISQAREKLFGGDVYCNNSEELRYCAFLGGVPKPKFQFARMPPPQDSAKYHSSVLTPSTDMAGDWRGTQSYYLLGAEA